MIKPARMKQIILLFAILLLTNGITKSMQALGVAQNSVKPLRELSSPQVRAQAMVSKIYSACNPAGYQASKVNYAFVEYYSRLDELTLQPRPDQSEFEMKQKMLKDKLNEKLQTIFTPEQMRMWTAYKEKERIEW